MTHRQMSCESFVAAADDNGTIEKIVSVFGNVDYAGDRVNQGAFTKSLERWATGDGPIPVIFSHQWNVLEAHVGVVEDARELAPGDPLLVQQAPQLADFGGLWVRERYDMDQPFAARLHQLQKDRRIKESSFAYDVLNEKRAKDGVNDLLELEIIEVGPTLKGMNPDTVVIDAKTRLAAQRAAGRKAALDPHETETSDAAWDGPANEARLADDAGADTLAAAFAWVDPQGDPQTKAAYKFIHHEVADDGTAGAANLAACTAGSGVLNGARDGTSIPDADYQGVYDHLAKHLTDAGQDAPALTGPSSGSGDGSGSGGGDQGSSTGTASRPGRRKALVTLDGSYEQLQERLRAAVNEWAGQSFDPYELYCALLEATYPDHVIVYVELWSQPYGGGDYQQVPHSIDATGAVVLGEPTPVELTGMVTPKCLTPALRDRKAAAFAAAKAAPAAVVDVDTEAARSVLAAIDIGVLEAI